MFDWEIKGSLEEQPMQRELARRNGESTIGLGMSGEVRFITQNRLYPGKRNPATVSLSNHLQLRGL